jgi:hypothetical protein
MPFAQVITLARKKGGREFRPASSDVPPSAKGKVFPRGLLGSVDLLVGSVVRISPPEA